jgi:hypothetical protein
MIEKPEVLEATADEFVRLADNSGSSLTAEGFAFDTDATKKLLVYERRAQPALGNKVVTTVRSATEWFGELATLAGRETSIYDITYLKIAVKNRLKKTEGVLHG